MSETKAQTNDVKNLAKLFEMAYIFFDIFKLKGESNRKKGIPDSTVLFYMVAAFIDINTIDEYEFESGAINSRCVGFMSRGGPTNVQSCLTLMIKNNLVETKYGVYNSNPERTRILYNFTQNYTDKIHKYAVKMAHLFCEQDINIDKEASTLVARRVLDFYIYQYLPCWNFFVRVAMREAKLSQSEKERLYDNVFSGPYVWFIINRFGIESINNYSKKIEIETYNKWFLDHNWTSATKKYVKNIIIKTKFLEHQGNSVIMPEKLSNYLDRYIRDVVRAVKELETDVMTLCIKI